jgi:hypothetical protein
VLSHAQQARSAIVFTIGFYGHDPYALLVPSLSAPFCFSRL